MKDKEERVRELEGWMVIFRLFAIHHLLFAIRYSLTC